MAIDLFTNPQILLEHKIAGLSITRYLDTNANSVWYEAQEDAGEKRLVYVYKDSSIRDKDRIRIHNFHTTIDESIVVDECQVPLFFIVGGYRIMMDKALRDYLMASSNLPLEIEDWQAERVLGHGYKGVTFIAKRKHGPSTEYALKLTIAEEYENNSYLPEVDRMVELARKDRDHFPQIHDSGEWECHIENDPHKLVYFVEDLMPGQTLEKYLETQATSLNMTFLDRFVREMLAALVVLESLELMHDDLHASNINVHDSLTGIRPSLIDFGSAKKRGPTKKKRDDIRNLAMHIAQILNLIDMQQTAKTRHEDHILAACQSLHAVMSDDDPMRQVDKASDLLDHFDRYFTCETFKQTLERPFDFGNAEEVIDNTLLHRLAAKSFPWRDKIECSANILLIGPRGCGKTTVFRSMSFNCLADAGEIVNALSRPYVGLYISCNKEFRQRFSAINPEILQRRESEIRHYFNFLVLREFINSLISCYKESHLGESDIRKFLTFLSEQAGVEVDVKYSSIDALYETEGVIVRKLDSVRIKIWNDQSCDNLSEQGFVYDLAKFSGEKIEPFQGKLLYLFVDDYTERKIAREAQRAINHILFVPNGIYKSKISSEVFGVPPDQTFGNFLDQDRDYKEWNLGTLYYLSLPSPKQKKFLSEIVDNRLEMCGYQGKIIDIIGESKYAEDKLERSLKQQADVRKELRNHTKEGVPDKLAEQNIEAKLAKEGKVVYYHGWDTICDLCTGDVSNVLEVLNRMYEECSVTKSRVNCIEARAQDAVIQGYSLQYISKIKGIPHYGEKLFQIVDAFGNMCARLLREYPLVTHGDRLEPYQLIRIELDEGFVRSSNDILNVFKFDVSSEKGIDDNVAIMILLQRYCIFIDAEESRSRRNTLANKVILRRIFCPAFRAGLVNSESFTLDKRKWQSLCSDPKGYCDRYVDNLVREAKRRRGEDEETLYDNLND